MANYLVSKATFPLNKNLPAEIQAALESFLAADTTGPALRASTARPLGPSSDLSKVAVGTDILTFSGLVGGVPIDLGGLTPTVRAGLEVVAFNGITSKIVELSDFAGVVLLGRGNDTVTKSGSGDVAVNAGDGRDTITTSDGNDTVNAGTGNDSVSTGLGDDLVLGGDGADIINTGDGDDTVNAGEGNDRVLDTAGNNMITGGGGNDTIRTGTGIDTIYAGEGNDSILTGAGNDTIYTGGGVDTVNAGAGSDVIVLESPTAGGNLTIDGSIGIGDTLDLTLVGITSAAAAGATGATITLDNGATVNVTSVERFMYENAAGSAELVSLQQFLAAFT